MDTHSPAPRTLIVLHPRRDPAPPGLLASYAAIPGHDAVLATDLPPPSGLYTPPNHAGTCRDYVLYAARLAYPTLAYYWLIDADLRIHTPHPADFFAALAANPHQAEAHLLALKLTQATCLFTLIRLSGRAADHLLQARRQATTNPTHATPKAWPADHIFVPTTLAQAGLPTADINPPPPARPHYTDASAASPLTHDETELAATPPDHLIYAPVRPLESWLAEEAARLGPAAQRTPENPAGLRAPPAANRLERLGFSCLRSQTHGNAALVPLLLAESLWRAHPAQPNNRAAACQTALTRHFAAGPSIGTAHPALCQLPRNNVEIVAPADFESALGHPISRLPEGLAIPYAYDLPARALILTLHSSLAATLAHPFLYGGQRECARAIARIPLANLQAALGPIQPDASPVLVFSVGRTGSTLFKQLIACVTPRAISEPDAITQLTTLLPDTPEPDRLPLIHYALAPLLTLRLPGDVQGNPQGPCVIKLRSQANGIAADIAAAFPHARYVFMLRERHAWARSTFRAFGMRPANAANRLAQALRALRRLQLASVDLTLISYENLTANPHATIASLTGATPDTDPALHARITAAAAADSQAGHTLSRDRSTRQPPGEPAWMEAFETAWSATRPAALIEELGLDY